MKDQHKIKLGWKEYLSLPDLGIDHIHAKIDTGAKTSAIHTLKYKVLTKNKKPWVKFVVAPFQEDDDTTFTCECPIKDQRKVTSSNGHTSERIVIETKMIIGDVERDIEVTLVCRKKMKFRMLLGRQAMRGMLVEPDKSHLTNKTNK